MCCPECKGFDPHDQEVFDPFGGTTWRRAKLCETCGSGRLVCPTCRGHRFVSDHTGNTVVGELRRCPSCMVPLGIGPNGKERWEHSPEREADAIVTWLQRWRQKRGDTPTLQLQEPAVQDVAAARRAREEEQARKDQEAAAVWEAWKAKQAEQAAQASASTSTAAAAGEELFDDELDDIPF